MNALFLRLDHAVAIVCRWGVGACFLGLFVLLSLGILQRLLPVITMTGYDELVELLFVWMTFLGGLALWREGSLYRVDILERAIGPVARRMLASLIHLAMLAIAVVLAWAGLEFLRQSGETTPFLQVDKMWWYAAIPACGALMAVYSLAAAWRSLRGQVEAPRAVATLS